MRKCMFRKLNFLIDKQLDVVMDVSIVSVMLLTASVIIMTYNTLILSRLMNIKLKEIP